MYESKPELGMIGRDDLQNGKKWEICKASPVRGFPLTNIDGKRMYVPLGISGLDRCIRAHEMTHAKVSPNTEDFRGWLMRGQASKRALLIAEETRVNFLLKSTGIPIEKFLTDGRESMDAWELINSIDWQQYLSSGLSGVFTAGEIFWAKEAKKINPNWSTKLQHAQRFVRDYWERQVDIAGHLKAISQIENPESKLYAEVHALNKQVLAGEKPIRDRDGKLAYQSLNTGFYYTETLAQHIDKLLTSEDMVAALLRNGDMVAAKDSVLTLITGLSENSRTYTYVERGTLRFWPVKPTRSVPRAISRKRTPMSSGTNPRRITRLLTDPERRIFDHMRKAPAGIFLIDGHYITDQEVEGIKELVSKAPDCTIAIYSVKPWKKCVGTSYYEIVGNSKYTMSILAENGKALSQKEISKVLESLTVAPGCDLDAIKWAINKRKTSKTPIIWFTDGRWAGTDEERAKTAAFAYSKGVIFAGSTQEREALRDMRALLEGSDLDRERYVPYYFYWVAERLGHRSMTYGCVIKDLMSHL